MKSYLLPFLLGVFIGLFVFGILAPEPVTIRTSDTIPGDSIPYAVKVDRPVPKYIDTGSCLTEWLNYPVDTQAIIRDYFSKVYYVDTLKDDSSAFIAIIDTLAMNRIAGRGLLFANRKPTVINNTTTVVQAQRFAAYAGLMYKTGIANKPDYGPSLMLVAPAGIGASYAYGLNEKTHTFTLVYKLRLRQKVPPD